MRLACALRIVAYAPMGDSSWLKLYHRCHQGMTSPQSLALRQRRQLCAHGLQPPAMPPESAILIQLNRALAALGLVYERRGGARAAGWRLG